MLLFRVVGVVLRVWGTMERLAWGIATLRRSTLHSGLRVPNAIAIQWRHATKKAGGSTKNGRDSLPKFLGVKKYGGERVKVCTGLYHPRSMLLRDCFFCSTCSWSALQLAVQRGRKPEAS